MAVFNQNTQDFEIFNALMRYVDERLNQWAAWYRQRERLGIGYPPCSVEYRMMTEGCIPRDEYLGLKPMPTNESAEEVEAFIVEMSKQRKQAAEALRKHYFEKGNSLQKGKTMQISESQFEKLVVFARGWLLGRLTSTGKFRRVMQDFKQLETQQYLKNHIKSANF